MNFDNDDIFKLSKSDKLELSKGLRPNIRWSKIEKKTARSASAEKDKSEIQTFEALTIL